MTHQSTPRQSAVLMAAEASDGYLDDVADPEAAEQCAQEAWLLAEGHTGYALTMEGRIVLQALQ